MKYYVYELINPIDQSVFYVGKGTGNRIDQHEKEARKGVCSKKCNMIRYINSKGLDIDKRKVEMFHHEQEAYDYETDLILKYGLENLTNVLPGGQVAHERFAPDKHVDESTPLDMLVYLKNNMDKFVPWAKETNFGIIKVVVSGPKLPAMLLDMFYNHLAHKLFNKAMSDDNNKPVIRYMFNLFDLEVA